MIAMTGGIHGLPPTTAKLGLSGQRRGVVANDNVNVVVGRSRFGPMDGSSDENSASGSVGASLGISSVEACGAALSGSSVLVVG